MASMYNVNYLETPEFLGSIKNITVAAGRDASLSCFIKNSKVNYSRTGY